MRFFNLCFCFLIMIIHVLLIISLDVDSQTVTIEYCCGGITRQQQVALAGHHSMHRVVIKVAWGVSNTIRFQPLLPKLCYRVF